MLENTGQLTYNPYQQKYILKFWIADCLSPETIKCDSLKHAMWKIADLKEFYPQVKITINL